MAYIGKDLPGILNHNKLFETFTGDGIITSKVLSRTPGSVNNVDVFYDGAFQTPGVDFTLSGNTITFTSAPPNGVVVSILAGEDSQVITPEENTVTSAKITNNTITNALLPSTIPSTKLSGSALPAIDGSNLQNVSTGLLSGSSDPTITQNPASGLGTVYTNTSSGEVFVLINATTDANVWVNVGGGVYGVGGKAFGGLGGGTDSGYVSGGVTLSNVIEKFSFASGPQSINDVGDLTTNRGYAAGASSTDNGYVAGGGTSEPSFYSSLIENFSFATGTSQNSIGDLSTTPTSCAGTHSSTHGYVFGGHINEVRQNKVDKYSFASGTQNATVVGTLSRARAELTAYASYQHAYTAGGGGPSGTANNDIIERFSFASEGNLVDIANLTQVANGQGGCSSDTHGYTLGGHITSTNTRLNVIDRFSFESNSNAEDVGDLTVERSAAATQSSTTYGYASGGYGSNPTGAKNVIDKVQFAAGVNSSDVGDISSNRYYPTGQQV